MLAFALGAFAVLGDVRAAAATGVVVAVLLALKAVLHDWVKRLTWPELRSGLVLLAMTCILLPLLPNRTVDPWAAINPFELLAYDDHDRRDLILWLRRRQNGGRANGRCDLGRCRWSCLVYSRHLDLIETNAREHSEQRMPLLAGTIISWATMMGRVLLIVGLVNAGLLARLAAIIIPRAATSGSE